MFCSLSLIKKIEKLLSNKNATKEDAFDLLKLLLTSMQKNFFKKNDDEPLKKAEEIKKLRFKLLLTQKDFAKLIDASHISVNRWEQGLTIPSTNSIAKMAAISKKLESIQL